MLKLALNREESRQIDTIAIHEYKIPGIVLMENAARCAVNCLATENLALNPQRTVYSHTKGNKILICCGKGNNAGDGFAMVRHFLLLSFEPIVWLFASPSDLTGDATTNYEIAKQCGIPIIEFQDDLWNEFEKTLAEANWVVDALLGTGAHGAPREPFAEAIRKINAARKSKQLKVLALDLPSGFDVDTGLPSEPTIKADVTSTFFSQKTGFLQHSATKFTGKVYVCDIGFPPQLVKK
ncbi:MAG: NAD(P)H-hydrate epimerase [Planctomycetaceae bacterium]|jgi:NAD(P)H-hydrate epimerase|nr:NAD(P)H-hydrate epimerase [Planctomycetaceae bacterium]